MKTDTGGLGFSSNVTKPTSYSKNPVLSCLSVTEIVGGSMERSEEDLPSRYLTFCDPRCSVEQVGCSDPERINERQLIILTSCRLWTSLS